MIANEMGMEVVWWCCHCPWYPLHSRLSEWEMDAMGDVITGRITSRWCAPVPAYKIDRGGMCVWARTEQKQMPGPRLW